ncbi:MAG: STAS domain-containing protein [Proteobacteria bacterium]|nr:STAS domain-containing protein [Pseudomonadota bacterium]
MWKKAFPFLAWFKGYHGACLRTDALAGVTVALVLIPQSMAYAALAGLPAYYGLYASFLPPLVAALFGSSRHLATGPVAVVSLMTAASLEPLAAAGSAGYIAYAILLALIVGTLQLALGLLRLGLVVNFLSHPVVNGFTNAAAIIIATSQLGKLFGVQVDKADHHYETVVWVVQAAINYTHWPTLLLGAVALAVMIALHRLRPRLPNVLIVVALSTLLSWAVGFEHNATTRLTAVDSPLAVQLVKSHNHQYDLLPPLMERRTRLHEALALAPDNSLAKLDALRDLDAVNYHIQIVRFGIHTYRTQLRQLLFQGAAQPDGSLQFYRKDELPSEREGDGRTWRIQVGARKIETEQMVMIGGGQVIGSVPRGLPRLAWPDLNPAAMIRLLPYAAIIALLGFMEAISIAKAMAARTGHRLDPNQELIGQGLGNILGAVGQSYPTSGSFSRSAVNLQAGAISGMSSVFTSLIVVVTLLFFTPLLYHLPQCVLAAVIMVAVIGLLNVSGIVHAWRAQWYDGFIAVIAFIATLTYAPHLDKGIMVGVVLSLLVFLYKSMRPKVVSLSRGEDLSLHAALSHGLKECRYIDMIRFDGPLFFASASYLEDEVINHMETKPDLRFIIIESSGISMIDASGEEALTHIIDRIRSAGIDVSFAGLHQDILDVMTRTGMIRKIGVEHIYANVDKALNSVYGQAHQQGSESDCPLVHVIYDDLGPDPAPAGRADRVWRLQDC